MKNSMIQTLKRIDKQVQIEKALKKLREESFRYYQLAVKSQENAEILLEQNKRLLEENTILKSNRYAT